VENLWSALFSLAVSEETTLQTFCQFTCFTALLALKQAASVPRQLLVSVYLSYWYQLSYSCQFTQAACLVLELLASNF